MKKLQIVSNFFSFPQYSWTKLKANLWTCVRKSERERERKILQSMVHRFRLQCREKSFHRRSILFQALTCNIMYFMCFKSQRCDSAMVTVVIYTYSWSFVFYNNKNKIQVILDWTWLEIVKWIFRANFQEKSIYAIGISISERELQKTCCFRPDLLEIRVKTPQK